MKKIAAFTLLAILTLAVATPAFARTHRNAEARAADKRAKALRKAQKEQAKAQQKAMKQAQKDKLKSAGH
jgi:type II secretory pathway pseudopilin PulG